MILTKTGTILMGTVPPRPAPPAHQPLCDRRGCTPHAQRRLSHDDERIRPTSSSSSSSGQTIMADTIVPLRCVQTGTPVLPRGILEDPEPPASGAILRLPHEILDTIFSYSDSNTLAKVTRACRGLHRSAFLALWKKPILIHHLRAKDFGEESTVYRSQRLLQTLFEYVSLAIPKIEHISVNLTNRLLCAPCSNPRVGPCIKDLRIIHEKDDNTLPIEPPPRILPISPCGVTLEPYTVLLKKVTDSRCLDNLRSLSLEGEGSEVFLSYSPRLDRLECLSIEHLDDTSLLLDGESPWWKQSSGLKRLELRQTGMTGSGDKFALGPLLRHCRNTLETFEIYECEWPLKLLERVGLRRLHTLIIDVNGTRDGEGVDDGGVGQVLDFLHRHAATLRRIWLLHMRNLFSPNKPACEYSQAHLCTELFLDESTQEGWVSLCPLIAVFKRLRVFAARDCMGILDSSLAYIVSALSESKHTLRKLLLPIPGPTYVVDLCRNITRHLPELNHLQFSADHLSKNGMEHDAVSFSNPPTIIDYSATLTDDTVSRVLGRRSSRAPMLAVSAHSHTSSH